MRFVITAMGAVAVLVALVLLAGVWEPEDGQHAPDAFEHPGPGGGGTVASDAEGQGEDEGTLHGRGVVEEGQAAGEWTLAGRVIDAASGSGVVGAMVIAFAPNMDGRPCSAWSREEGRYQLDGLVRGRSLLFVWHPLHVSPGLEALLIGDDAEEGWAAIEVEVPEGGGALPDRVLTVTAGRRIEGRVVGAEGRPVAGARIRIKEGRWYWILRNALGPSAKDWDRYLSISSDEDGRFAVACLPQALGPICLASQGPGFVGRWTEPLVLDPALPPAQVVLRTALTATVSGRTLCGDGRPAQPVRVTPTSRVHFYWADIWSFDFVDSVVADGDGAWTLEGLPPGPVAISTYWIRPYLEGSRVQLEPLMPGERRTGVDVVLPERYVLRGRLLGSGLTRLQGEILEIRESGTAKDRSADERDAVRASLVTRTEGRFEQGFGTPGPFEIVHLLATGDEHVLLRDLVLPADEMILTSEASPRTRLTLRVLDPAGAPVPQFSSSAISDATREAFRNADRREELFQSTAYGDAGFAKHEVPGRPPLWINVESAKDARENSLADVRLYVRVLPADQVVEIHLPYEDGVFGRVLGPDGAAVPGVVLRLVCERQDRSRQVSRIEVNQDGRYSARTGWGPWKELWLEVQVPRGFAVVPRFKPIVAAETPTLTLERGGRLAGHVIAPHGLPKGPDGHPLQVTVQWRSAHWSWPLGRLDVPVDADGRWSLEGVPVGRDLWITLDEDLVMQAGYLRPRVESFVHAGDLEVALPLVPALSIAGSVRHEDGSFPAPERFFVVARSLQGTNSHSSVDLDRADGKFEIRGLAQGAHRLDLHDEEHRMFLATRVAQAGDHEVALTIPRCGSLRVELVGRKRLWGVMLDIWVAGTTTRRCWVLGRDYTSFFEIGMLPVADTYAVVVQDLDGRVASVGGARVGSSVRLTLAEGLPLAGVLRRRDGSLASLDGMLCALNDAGCFWLTLSADGTFGKNACLPPGCYELRYVETDGTETVVATDVDAGRENLDLWLP